MSSGRDAKVTVSVSDWDPNGNVELIGSFTVTIAQLVQQLNQDFPLIGRKRYSILTSKLNDFFNIFLTLNCGN
jgi:hypothetical protein